MKSLLIAASFLIADFAATILFAAVLAITGSVTLGIAMGMALGVGQFAWLKLRGRPIDAMQLMSLFLVLGFGTLSLFTNDARFVMIKPSLIYVIIGITMLKPGWMKRYLPQRVQDTIPEVATLFGYLWSGLMFLSALLNGVLAAKLTPLAWAGFMSGYALISKTALFLVQYLTMRVMTRRRLRMNAAELARA